MALSTISSLNGNFKLKSLLDINFKNKNFTTPDIPTTTLTTNLYQSNVESTVTISKWVVYGNIHLSDGATSYNNNIAPPSYIDGNQSVILDANATYPLSYIQQSMTLPAGDYIVSLNDIVYYSTTYAPSTASMKISFGSTVILSNTYKPTNKSAWMKLIFLLNVPTAITDYFKVETFYGSKPIRISLSGFNLSKLSLTPVSGLLLNEDFTTPDVATGSYQVYQNSNFESDSTIISSWYLRGTIRINDGNNTAFTVTETYVPSSNNQFISLVVASGVAYSYARQPITLNAGTYLLTFFYILGNDALTNLSFQILFNNVEIAFITLGDYSYWLYYSVTFYVDSLKTADFKLQVNYLNSSAKKVSISNLKLRRIY